MPSSIAMTPTAPQSPAPIMYCRPSLSFQISPMTSRMTSGAELPTAETMLRKEMTLSRSFMFGVMTRATMFTDPPKLVLIDQRTAIVTM